MYIRFTERHCTFLSEMICYCKMYTFYVRLDRGLEDEYNSKKYCFRICFELYFNELYMANLHIFVETNINGIDKLRDYGGGVT